MIPQTAVSHRWLAVMVALSATHAGCGPDLSRVAPPGLSPDSVARDAVAAYDRNRDSLLDNAELAACPSLRSILKACDSNNDGKLHADEIARRLDSYGAGDVGVTSASCQVTLDGEPLVGATVTYTPESFLGSAFKPASGVTREAGIAALNAEGASAPGAPYGLYRVTISLKDSSGRETLPARYNGNTTLGAEISPDPRTPPATFKLTSR